MGAAPHNNNNPVGRPKGSPNKKNLELFAALEARGDRDPIELLSSFASDTSKSDDFRAQCANYILPYKYAKRQAAPHPRFVDDPLTVLDFQSIQTIEQAQDRLKEIAARAAAGELELQIAADLSSLLKNWVLSKQASIEIDIKAANATVGIGDQVIRIEGGLPPLPGSNITMPVINGHEAIDGTLINHEPAVPAPDDPSQTNSVQDQTGPDQASDNPPDTDTGQT